MFEVSVNKVSRLIFHPGLIMFSPRMTSNSFDCFFIPMLLDTGGNAGNQTAITIIRGLAIGDVNFKNVWKVVRTEVQAAIFMGLIVGVVAYLRAILLQGEMALALVVGLTMGSIVLLAISTGITLPLISKRLGLDPAVLAGPITTSVVDIIGLINYKYNNLSISTEIIKKIKNPNKLLLRNAEIIKKIKFGEKSVFQETDYEKSNIDLSFEQPAYSIDQFKERIFSIINNSSQSGNGISFIDLFNKLEISEDKLRSYIRDLEMESKIYQSEENFYQTY